VDIEFAFIDLVSIFLCLFFFVICSLKLVEFLVIFAGFLHLYAKPFRFEFDPKIERTFHPRTKRLKLEEQRAKAQETSSTMEGGEGDQRRTLRDFVTPRL